MLLIITHAISQNDHFEQKEIYTRKNTSKHHFSTDVQYPIKRIWDLLYQCAFIEPDQGHKFT